MSQQKKKLARNPLVTPIHVALPMPQVPDDVGRAGREAARAATLHQLEQYADEVEHYVQSAQMDALLDRVQTELHRADGSPRMRLRKD